MSESTIDGDPSTAYKEESPGHIDFEPQDQNELRALNKLLNKELQIRLKDKPEKLEDALAMDLEERRSLLRTLLLGELELSRARGTIDREELAKSITSEHAIPCTLHMLMRVSARLFWSLLWQSAVRCGEGESKTFTKFVDAVTGHMNAQVLGGSAQWTVPVGKKKPVEPRNMTG